MNVNKNESADEKTIRVLIEDWAGAVRAKNYDGVLAHHSPDILMFDVPPPFLSKGIAEYKKTWDLFFKCSQHSGFEIMEMNITAGSDVAFVAAQMRCAGAEPNGEITEVLFRLTIGLQKIAGQWTFMHEHHSVPAT